jgi:hypothetical protein
VEKDLFWNRVDIGKERADSLIREVLSQTAVCLRGKGRASSQMADAVQTQRSTAVGPKGADEICSTLSASSENSALNKAVEASSADILTVVEGIVSVAEGFDSSSPPSSPFAHSLQSESTHSHIETGNMDGSRSESGSGTALPATATATANTSSSAYMPVVEIFGIFETIDHFVLELELMQSIDLYDKLADVGRFAEEKVKGIILQVPTAPFSSAFFSLKENHFNF